MITVKSFAGISLDGPNYTGILPPGARPFARSAQHTRLQAPGGFSRYVRSDPKPRTFQMPIVIEDTTDALIRAHQDTLLALFLPGLEGELIVDFDGVERSLACVVDEAAPAFPAASIFTAQLTADDPRWMGAAIETTTESITTSGESFTVTRTGNADDERVVIRLTPITVKATSAGQRFLTDVIVASRAVRASGTWALMIEFNHAAEVAASRSQADGDDVRVLIDGFEVPFWVGESGSTGWNQATTRLFVNTAFAPRKMATLLQAVTNVSPADGGELLVEKEDTREFETSGAIVFENELILYDGVTEVSGGSRAAFQNIERGARGTTAAAHNAATEGYWSEHRIALLTGHLGETAQDARPDIKPLLNLASANTTNARHVWAQLYDAANPGRSMTWFNAYRPLDGRADRILTPIDPDDPLTALTFEYQADGAVAGKPKRNIWRRPIPWGTPLTGTILGYTRVIDDTLALLVTGLDDAGSEVTLDRETGAQASAVRNVAAAASPIYDISLRARSQVALETPPGAVSSSAVVPAAAYNTTAQQQFTVESDGFIRKLRVYLANSDVTSRTITASIWSDNGSDAVLSNVSGNISMGTLPATSEQWMQTALTVPIPVSEGQVFWIRVFANSTEVTWHGYVIPYSGGISGTPGLTLRFAVLSDDLEFDPSAEAEDGEQITITAPDLRYDPDGVPYVGLGARQSVYHFDRAVVTSQETLQAITISAVLGLSETIEIDPARGTALNLDTGESVWAGIEFSDPDGRFKLLPGENTLTFDDVGLVSVEVQVDTRSRWQ